MRVAFVLVCSLAAACAAERPPVELTTRSTKSLARPPAEELSPSELRERELSRSLDAARTKTREPREFAKIEARTIREIAELRFERGDERGAFDAIESASRAAWFSEDAELLHAASRAEFRIKRAASLRASERGDHAKSLRLLDELALGRQVTAEERETITGDRLLVLERQGDVAPEEVDLAALYGALDRIFGLFTLLEGPAMFDTVGMRGASIGADAIPLGDPGATVVMASSAGRALEKGDDAHELPSAEDAPAVETGTIDHTVVSKMMSTHRRSIESCYDRALRSGSRLSGKLEVDIEVEPSGSVTEADVLSAEFHGTELARCIASAIRRWKFPPIDEGKRMTVPFVLGRAL